MKSDMKMYLVATAVWVLGAAVLSGTTSLAGELVVYTSVDQVFSEPILRDFKKQTGTDVKAVYDVEASKTTGLVNRLLAEKSRPKCDVFWNNEVARTVVLKDNGVLQPYRSPSAKNLPAQFKDKDGYYAGFAARARVLVYNTNLLQESELPESIFELTMPKWKNRVTMAYPLFGTTATHLAALYVVLGKERTEQYLKTLQANGVLIVDGNSVVRDIVAAGEVPLGFTDTDDVNVAIESGKPVKMIYPDRNGIGTLLIPNTAALIRGGPNPDEGRRFLDYLLSREVESKIAFSESANMPLRDGVSKPRHIPDYSSIKAMEVDYQVVAERVGEAARLCQKLFVR